MNDYDQELHVQHNILSKILIMVLYTANSYLLSIEELPYPY